MSVMCCTFYKPVIGFPKLRLTESRIVIHPSADYRVYPLCYLLYAHMHLTIQIPTAYLSLYFQRRLLTYRRSKSSKVLPCLAIACRSWSEGIAQKVKGCMLRVTLAVTILTIDYLGLLFIQLQSAVCKPFTKHAFKYCACFSVRQ